VSATFAALRRGRRRKSATRRLGRTSFLGDEAPSRTFIKNHRQEWGNGICSKAVFEDPGGTDESIDLSRDR